MAIEVCSEIFVIDNVEFSIELTADERGLTACRLEERPARLQKCMTNAHLKEAVAQLRSYFEGDIQMFTVKVAPDGTTFQQEVWQATALIPPRQLRSYAWIAKQIGSPKAVRAVAQALGANPLLLFVPCHRVIRSNGELGGFSCGTEWKTLLLQHEGADVDQLELCLSTQ